MSIQKRLKRAENTPRVTARQTLHVFTHPLHDARFLAGGKSYDLQGIEALRQSHDLLFIDYGIDCMGFDNEH